MATENDKIEKLTDFILKNHLNFTGDSSDLNSDCCVISGFALHIEANVEQIDEAIYSARPDASTYLTELNRVFAFAKSNDYQYFWKTPAAKKQYAF